MLAALVLAVPWIGAPSLPPARVELLEGRAELATAQGIVQAFGPERIVQVEGSAYFELRVRARARVDWPGAASLELLGPATLEWRASTSSTEALKLRVFSCENVLFESRRAALEIELPGGWRCELPRGAGSIQGRHDGAFDLRLDAGSPSFLSVRTSEQCVWPSLTVLAGARLTLVSGAHEPLYRDGSERRVLALYARDEGSAWERQRPTGAWRGREWPWKTDA